MSDKVENKVAGAMVDGKYVKQKKDQIAWSEVNKTVSPSEYDASIESTVLISVLIFTVVSILFMLCAFISLRKKAMDEGSKAFWVFFVFFIPFFGALIYFLINWGAENNDE